MRFNLIVLLLFTFIPVASIAEHTSLDELAIDKDKAYSEVKPGSLVNISASFANFHGIPQALYRVHNLFANGTINLEWWEQKGRRYVERKYTVPKEEYFPIVQKFKEPFYLGVALSNDFARSIHTRDRIWPIYALDTDRNVVIEDQMGKHHLVPALFYEPLLAFGEDVSGITAKIDVSGIKLEQIDAYKQAYKFIGYNMNIAALTTNGNAVVQTATGEELVPKSVFKVTGCEAKYLKIVGK